jgi:hypothetical protein
MKMMHKEVGICRRYVHHKEMCIREKLRCDTLDIKVQNLVHKQVYVQYNKTSRGSNVSILKGLHLSDISCGT